MRRWTYSLLLFLIYAFSASADSFDYLPASTTGSVIRHQYFSLSYHETHEQAEWVAYELTADEARGGHKRTNNFRPDDQINTGSATLADYKGSGFDRGHLAPAGDMAFSRQAMSQSFLMSNMSPQRPGFNRGIWRQLEEMVRVWAVENDQLYVVCGGVLENSLLAIGPNDVSVPRYYYKVLLDYQQPEIKAIAFLMPNKKGTKSLDQYVVTIDKVEQQTGIDFFPALPDHLENKLEQNVDLSQWSFSKSSLKKNTDNHSKYHTDRHNKVNVNTASASVLDQLKGIGPAKAQAIINARPYRSVDDLTRARGIGPATLDQIRPYVTTK